MGVKKRVFTIPLEPLGPLILFVAYVVAIPWGVALFFLAERHFYMDDRSWWLLVLLAIPTAVVAWVLTRNKAGRFVLSNDEVTFVRFRSFGMRQRVSFPRAAVEEVVFRILRNFGFPERYDVSVRLRDGGEQVVWSGTGHERLNRSKLTEVAQRMRDVGVTTSFLAQDTGTGGRAIEWAFTPRVTGMQRLSIALLAGPWLAGAVVPQLTHSVPIIAAAGVALLIALALFTTKMTRKADGNPPGLRGAFASSLFFSAVYYLVAATVSYRGFH